jgi:hypothetical protein
MMAAALHMKGMYPRGLRRNIAVVETLAAEAAE